MIDQTTIDAILAGEFSGEFATEEQKSIRVAHVVKRLGSTRGTANIKRLIDECEHTPGVWRWSDGTATVVDIRPKDPAAVSLGSRGGSVTSDAKAAAARTNGRKGGRPRKQQ